MSKAFASQADLQDKAVSFTRLSAHAWAYTAEGDPNTGVIIGDNAVMVIDTQATPAMAEDVIRRIREVTDMPVKYVVLSHYHAVRVLGASAYRPEHIVASHDTYELIRERGEADKASEIGRFPRLFRALETLPPGLTWPTLTFKGEMTLWLGALEVKLLQLGRGHTKGDTIVWLPEERTLFSGDLVEYDFGNDHPMNPVRVDLTMRLADELEVPLLGEVPLYPPVLEGADRGAPIVVSGPTSTAAKKLNDVAGKIISALGVGAPA